MKSRMVPIGDTFNRFKRTVRDLSLQLDKNVELKIQGGDTELDRTIIDKISDPIMHLIRNSLDHGLESKQMRKEYDKPTMGTITLSASHEAGNIIIKVKDDGQGLDAEKIRKKL
jgi:two-component system chemotaxis sensor kinase CheA